MDKKLFSSIIIVLVLLSLVCVILSTQLVTAVKLEMDSKYNTIFVFNSVKIKCVGSSKIRITKPSDKTVTKSVDSDYMVEFKNADTNEAGLYKISCLDSAGAINATETFRALYEDVHFEEEAVEEKPVADVEVATKEVYTGTVSGKQGELKTFTLDGVTVHTMEFLEVTFTSATFTVQSDPIEITLEVGKHRNVDLDADGKDDVKVTLLSVDEDGRAKVEVINLAKMEEKLAEEKGIVPEVEEKPSKAGLWMTILVILVVIVVGYFVLKKRKGKKGQVKFSKENLGL